MALPPILLCAGVTGTVGPLQAFPRSRQSWSFTPSRPLPVQVPPSHRDPPGTLPAAARATSERLTSDRVLCSKGSCVSLRRVECCRPAVFSGGSVPGHPSPPRGRASPKCKMASCLHITHVRPPCTLNHL